MRDALPVNAGKILSTEPAQNAVKYMRNVFADPARDDIGFVLDSAADHCCLFSPLRLGCQPEREFPYPEPEPEVESKPTHEEPCIHDRFHLSSSLIHHGVSAIINAIPVPDQIKLCNILI